MITAREAEEQTRRVAVRLLLARGLLALPPATLLDERAPDGLRARNLFVEAYQRLAGLPPDGLWGPQTERSAKTDVLGLIFR